MLCIMYKVVYYPFSFEFIEHQYVNIHKYTKQTTQRQVRDKLHPRLFISEYRNQNSDFSPDVKIFYIYSNNQSIYTLLYILTVCTYNLILPIPTLKMLRH